MTEFLPARSVSEGSILAIVAPAGPFDREAFEAGVKWLRERYEVRFSDGIFSKTGYFAGSDVRRRRELQDAIDDPEVDAILCARGGFGATRLLPELDPETVTAANKLLVGFSDVTALHALWARAGVRSVHAPMVAALGSASGETRQKWIDALEDREGESCPRVFELETISSAAELPVEGRLFGGNLAVLGALIGTPYAPPLEETILFLEDVGERPYRVDRMLTTMRQAGWLEAVEGVVLGAFTESQPGDDGISIEDVFRDHFGEWKKPVLSGLAAGHIRENEPLVFGKTARILGGNLELD
ncbi:MAG: LD-carboxypeptidase [Verrucomicrobiales bacterium]|nr:LD-carboxypeptidase [Verrucomicrobiales bacterium]